jgi:hypothetical protein
MSNELVYWYPENMDERVEWHENWVSVLPDLKDKYNLSAEILAQANADNVWIKHWVTERHKEENLGLQLTKYFNTIAVGDEGKEAPIQVTFAFDAAPPEVPPGVKARAQKVAEQIKGSMNYAEADGTRAGIVSKPKDAGALSDLIAAAVFKAMTNYGVESKFKKEGQDAIQIEFRYKGGAWQIIKVLSKSPGVFAIPPLVAGEGLEVEIRVILLKDDMPVGNYSPIYTIYVKP